MPINCNGHVNIVCQKATQEFLRQNAFFWSFV